MELKFDTSKVYAIALEGGGAKGAYEVGVWKALDEVGIKYNAVAGTSVGALNGAMMASRDLETALQLWENVKFSQVFDADDEVMKKIYDGDLEGLDIKGLLKD
ncbi:MAG: patatin-like phospholipase family protein, partial [Anaerotignum sp.]|nr:patatin-like phospholipase family protein [Anaerotignum sp.]